MNLAQLRQWGRRSEMGFGSSQLLVAMLYGAFTSFAGMLLVAFFALPSSTLGRPEPLLSLPSIVVAILYLIGAVAGFPCGAVCGWWLYGFAHRLARTRRILATLLIFAVLYLPAACAVLVATRKDKTTTYARLSKLAVAAAVASALCGLSAHRNPFQLEERDRVRDDPDDTRSTINDQT